MSITIKKPQEIKKLAFSNNLVAKTLNYLRANTKAGMSLLEVNKMGEDFIYSHDAKPAFKGLYGFPAGVCTSLNEVIIHGIPDKTILKKGDILGLDIGVEKNGWFGDSAITIPIEEISKQDEDLISCSKDALYFAIDIIQEGMRFKELSYEIENFIRKRGFVPLEGYCGHGIGKKPHEDPSILNYIEKGSSPKQGPKIRNGMTFCIEPMICQKEGKPVTLSDKWSVVSKDGLNGSHYEHTVAIINKKAEILSID